jgi:hypothetical protein
MSVTRRSFLGLSGTALLTALDHVSAANTFQHLDNENTRMNKQDQQVSRKQDQQQSNNQDSKKQDEQNSNNQDIDLKILATNWGFHKTFSGHCT